MSSRRKRSVVNPTTPTSRATFRLVAQPIGATNREVDSLRQALLAQWAERGGIDDLSERLDAFEPSVTADTGEPQSQLNIWFSYDEGEDQTAVDNHPILSELSHDLQQRVRSALAGDLDGEPRVAVDEG